MAKDSIKNEGPDTKKLEDDLKKVKAEKGSTSELETLKGLGEGILEEVVHSGPTIDEALAAYPGGFLVDKKGAIYEIGFISQHFHAIENRYPRAREGQMYAFVQRIPLDTHITVRKED